MNEKELHKLRRRELLQLLLAQSREVQMLREKYDAALKAADEADDANGRLRSKLDEKDALIEKLKGRLDKKDEIIRTISAGDGNGYDEVVANLALRIGEEMETLKDDTLTELVKLREEGSDDGMEITITEWGEEDEAQAVKSAGEDVSALNDELSPLKNRGMIKGGLWNQKALKYHR